MGDGRVSERFQQQVMIRGRKRSKRYFQSDSISCCVWWKPEKRRFLQLDLVRKSHKVKVGLGGAPELLLLGPVHLPQTDFTLWKTVGK